MFDWMHLLQAALSVLVSVGSQAVQTHWNGNGTDGKINNAVNILKLAANAGEQVGEALKGAEVHPDIAAHAATIAANS